MKNVSFNKNKWKQPFQMTTVEKNDRWKEKIQLFLEQPMREKSSMLEARQTDQRPFYHWKPSLAKKKQIFVHKGIFVDGGWFSSGGCRSTKAVPKGLECLGVWRGSSAPRSSLYHSRASRAVWPPAGSRLTSHCLELQSQMTEKHLLKKMWHMRLH